MLQPSLGRYTKHAHRRHMPPEGAIFTERGITMIRLNANDERCEALFASGLQRSDDLTAQAVSYAISRTVQELGPSGCAGRMAQEFGDHPEAASERMRWARQIVGDLSGDFPPSPSPSSSPPRGRVRPAA
jgi:hypothetical protein